MSTSKEDLKHNSTTNRTLPNQENKGGLDISNQNIIDLKEIPDELKDMVNQFQNFANNSNLKMIKSNEKELKNSKVFKTPKGQITKDVKENATDGQVIFKNGIIRQNQFNKEGSDVDENSLEFKKFGLPDDLKFFFDNKTLNEMHEKQVCKLYELFELTAYKEFTDVEIITKKKELDLYKLKLKKLFEPIYTDVPGFRFDKKLLPLNLSPMNLKNYIENFLKKELNISINKNSDKLLVLMLNDLVKTFLCVFLVIDDALRSKKKEYMIISTEMIYYIMIFFNSFSYIDNHYYNKNHPKPFNLLVNIVDGKIEVYQHYLCDSDIKS
ncbi:hypothetical protein GVAV_000161 [Gurleya vavrai]